MNYFLTLTLIALTFICKAQVINKQHTLYQQGNPQECGITGDPNALSMIIQTVYRAKPDGYHAIFTTSFIGKSVLDVESQMNKKTDSLITAVGKLGIEPRDVLAEMTTLDPIFDVGLNGSSNQPSGYKVTENITFHVRDFNTIRYLAKTCLDFQIYDLTHVTPYVLQPDLIYDTLAAKSVEILEFKKELSRDIGYGAADGKAYFRKCRNVYYPNDMHLVAQIQNSRMYMHDLSQNSDIAYNRNLRVDSYNNLDLRSVDYVFNPNIIEPTIDFHYRIDYNYVFPPDEEEESENDENVEKVFYILNEEGELQQLSFGKKKKED
ncbi:MAG: hypothetical protein NXI10_02245 [bacterium]|nr:hypothetical protein [bacterium]